MSTGNDDNSLRYAFGGKKKRFIISKGKTF